MRVGNFLLIVLFSVSFCLLSFSSLSCSCEDEPVPPKNPNTKNVETCYNSFRELVHDHEYSEAIRLVSARTLDRYQDSSDDESILKALLADYINDDDIRLPEDIISVTVIDRDSAVVLVGNNQYPDSFIFVRENSYWRIRF